MARNAHSSMLGLVSSLGYVILWHLTGATVLTAFYLQSGVLESWPTCDISYD